MTNNATGAQTETLQVEKAPLMDYTAIRSTSVTKNTSSGAPEINVEFSEEGKDLFAAITRENINKRLAIVLDGRVFSAPIIRSEIAEGNARITGQFTENEARMLAAKINDAIQGQ
jgi:preprotein translocase subunit SecD